MKSVHIEDIKEKLKNNFDVKYREVKCDKGIIYVVFIENLSDSKFISEYMIAPLMANPDECCNIEKVKREIIVAAITENVNTSDEAVMHILSSDVVIVFSFLNRAIYCSAKGFSKRAVEIPITETVIKGPREGFVETIDDNISAVRRRVKTPNLKIEHYILGENSQTSAALLYIEGISPEKLVNYIRDKLNKIISTNKSGFILYANYIQEELSSKSTGFDTIGYTEKPDVAASKLSEGRVAVIVDGTPFAITAPYFFIENFQATDDYTFNKPFANMGRILRWMAFILSTLVPGLYLALVTFHFKLIPSTYIFRMAIFRAGVPVPTAVELLYMIFFFQIIREAGVRLPQPIGPTLSIVGALILGDAAVTSGLASQVTVVVVAITSISSYLVPKISAGVFIWNVIIIFFSSILGLPGFYTGFVVFVSHLASLTTCGYPYLYPLGTLRSFKFKDVILRGDLNKISSNILNGDEEN
jgi:hypothetical protein